jgi:hypothetical protein
MKHLIEGRVLQYCDVTIEVLAEPYFTCPARCNDIVMGICFENTASRNLTCKYFKGIAAKVEDPYSKCYEKAYVRCGLKSEIDAKRASRKTSADKAMAAKYVKASEAWEAFTNR